MIVKQMISSDLPTPSSAIKRESFTNSLSTAYKEQLHFIKQAIAVIS
jgi:hypothetical protein